MAKKTTQTPPIYSRCIMLSIYETDAMKLARVRGMLSAYLNIELQNTFFVSCESNLRASLNKSLSEADIRFSLMYINSKNGNRVSCIGVPDEDVIKLNQIIQLP